MSCLLSIFTRESALKMKNHAKNLVPGNIYAVFAAAIFSVAQAPSEALFATPREAASYGLVHTPVQYRPHRPDVSPDRRFPQPLNQVGLQFRNPTPRRHLTHGLRKCPPERIILRMPEKADRIVQQVPQTAPPIRAPAAPAATTHCPAEGPRPPCGARQAGRSPNAAGDPPADPPPAQPGRAHP